ncbi:MAG: DNA polymerase/3'-5' exonuclease PolX [Planctomycetota bacterium]|nr:MAG: DNA polymerase/3'-5' exonuclease PolX [Planctomycetota bacterium]
MENVELAAALDEVADLLEIQGANPFRVRAYRNAARFVRGYSTPLRKLVAEGRDLTELPTIGADMAKYLAELCQTGKLAVLEQLRSQVPPGLVEITQLPGVGPKRAQALWKELQITDLEQLRQAALAGRVAALRGFGDKTQQKILQAIERRAGQQKRFLLADADQIAAALREHMAQAPGVDRLEMAGSWRRRKETVGDLDLLVTAAEPGPVMDHFTRWPSVAEVVQKGTTRTTVRLRSGMQVDLRVVEPAAFGAALCYFTGSKEHNIRMRQRALERGLRISEYGVFELLEGEGGERREGRRVAGATEQEVYAAVGLPWIPPELREDRGELEAAERGELPALVELGDIRGDLQMHTRWSDGKNTLAEMVAACLARGYAYMAVTDHSPSLAMTGGLDPAKLRRQWQEIERVAADYPKIRILKSMEIDIRRDGSLDLADELLEQLDVVLVSIHSYLELGMAEQTRRVLKALEHPRVHILAHPTGRRLGQREPMQLDMDEVLHCAREHGVAVEANAQPERLDLNDVHLFRARELGVKVVISTDAHSTADLDLMRYGVAQARRAWLTPKHVLNTLPPGRFLQALRRRR